MPGPLHGYTVLELSEGVPSGYCGRLVAGCVATVIKVEHPAGDGAQHARGQLGGSADLRYLACHSYVPVVSERDQVTVLRWSSCGLAARGYPGGGRSEPGVRDCDRTAGREGAAGTSTRGIAAPHPRHIDRPYPHLG